MKNETAALLEKANNALNTGNTKDAQAYIKKINDYDKNPDALNILALCHAINNEFNNAENIFLQVLRFTNPTEILLGNIGLAQLHQNKISQAIESFLGSLNLNPNYYDTLKNIAVAYDHTNDPTNANIYAKKAYSIKPNDPIIINILAKSAFYNNELPHSIDLYKKSLSLQPQQPYTYAELANIYSISKAYEEAEAVLKQALNLLPGNMLLSHALGNFYETRNRYNEALHEYDKILSNDTTNTVAIASKARILIALKQFNLAEDILQKAYHEHPNNPDLCIELCNYNILKKDYETAYTLSKNLLSTINSESNIPAKIALAHSTACRYSNRLDEAKNTLSSVIEGKTLLNDMREILAFTMGDILDSMKQYDNAFNYYEIANKCVTRPGDIQYYESILTDISSTINRTYLESIGSSENQSSLPVFIVGMPRSGTSLVEQIISKHPDVYGAGELTDLWAIGNKISGAMNLIDYTKNLATINHEQLKKFSDTYIQKLTELSNSALRITDKLPHNFIHLGLIELLFPNAKVIHCQRHPFDTCLSIYFRKFNDNHVYAQNLEELARFYKKYMALMSHWQENSALSIHTVRYEDLVKDQETESRAMIDHIGLNWTNDVLRYFDSNRLIMTPSHHQASKPIYTDSMYRWKHYSKHMRPLVDILGAPEQYMQ